MPRPPQNPSESTSARPSQEIIRFFAVVFSPRNSPNKFGSALTDRKRSVSQSFSALGIARKRSLRSTYRKRSFPQSFSALGIARKRPLPSLIENVPLDSAFQHLQSAAGNKKLRPDFASRSESPLHNYQPICKSVEERVCFFNSKTQNFHDETKIGTIIHLTKFFAIYFHFKRHFS